MVRKITKEEAADKVYARVRKARTDCKLAGVRVKRAADKAAAAASAKGKNVEKAVDE